MANIYSIQKGTKAFTWKEAKNAIRVAQNVTFGADETSSSVLYRMLSIGFKPGNTDTTSKLAITMAKFVAGTRRNYQASASFDVTHGALFTEAGTLLVSGVTEVYPGFAAWSAYTGTVECNPGECKCILADSAMRFLVNIGGEKKYFNESAGVTKSFYTNATSPIATDANWALQEGTADHEEIITKYITISGSSAEDEEEVEEVEEVEGE